MKGPSSQYMKRALFLHEVWFELLTLQKLLILRLVFILEHYNI